MKNFLVVFFLLKSSITSLMSWWTGVPLCTTYCHISQESHLEALVLASMIHASRKDSWFFLPDVFVPVGKHFRKSLRPFVTIFFLFPHWRPYCSKNNPPNNFSYKIKISHRTIVQLQKYFHPFTPNWIILPLPFFPTDGSFTNKILHTLFIRQTHPHVFPWIIYKTCRCGFIVNNRAWSCTRIFLLLLCWMLINY